MCRQLKQISLPLNSDVSTLWADHPTKLLSHLTKTSFVENLRYANLFWSLKLEHSCCGGEQSIIIVGETTLLIIPLLCFYMQLWDGLFDSCFYN